MSEDQFNEEVRLAVVTGLSRIADTWRQVELLLVNTEVFDAELSMQVVESARGLMEKTSQLFRDVLYKEGYSKEDVDALVETYKNLNLE